MNIEYDNFIGFYRNVYPSGYCEHLIKAFDVLEENGVGLNRQQSENTLKHIKDDYQIGINIKNHDIEPFKWIENEREINEQSSKLFFNGLQKCFNEYSSKYSILKTNGNIRASTMKMQRTGPGGGYHVWHAEQSEGDSANRSIVYMLYLNSLDGEGGETEFLYQKLRIKPEENLMLFWPASYTHVHRGNPVLNETNKYIVTGWFYYD